MATPPPRPLIRHAILPFCSKWGPQTLSTRAQHMHTHAQRRLSFLFLFPACSLSLAFPSFPQPLSTDERAPAAERVVRERGNAWKAQLRSFCFCVFEHLSSTSTAHTPYTFHHHHRSKTNNNTKGSVVHTVSSLVHTYRLSLSTGVCVCVCAREAQSCCADGLEGVAGKVLEPQATHRGTHSLTKTQ